MLAERERCLASGMQGFLTKPLVPAELRQALERWAPLAGTLSATRSEPAPALHAVVAG
jgi:CheY-like chemotaxis protein